MDQFDEVLHVFNSPLIVVLSQTEFWWQNPVYNGKT